LADICRSQTPAAGIFSWPETAFSQLGFIEPVQVQSLEADFLGTRHSCGVGFALWADCEIRTHRLEVRVVLD
jgi:hypothetical protein